MLKQLLKIHILLILFHAVLLCENVIHVKLQNLHFPYVNYLFIEN